MPVESTGTRSPKDMKPIYTGSGPNVVRERHEEFTEKWGTSHPVIKKPWDSTWEELIAFLEHDEEIGDVPCVRPHD